MIPVVKALPEKVIVAVSGGSDSLAAVINLGKKVEKLIHYHHGGQAAQEEYEFVKNWASKYNYILEVEFCQTEIPSGVSKEAWWRECRYSFFKKQKLPVVVATTLNDAVEWYIFSCLTNPDGGRIIDYQNDNIIRPYLTTTKEKLTQVLKDKNIEWYEDPTNQDVDFCSRNFIRHKMIPDALKVNPGLFKMVKNRIFKKLEKQN